ncbi:MAG TPA: ATP-grasp fold amidoligase family protein [Pseudolabrys sp.]|nr:ATP-grasp fold amidoligase family protein [Pseudolabrys sp.]
MSNALLREDSSRATQAPAPARPAKSIRGDIFSFFDRALPHVSAVDRLLLLARFSRAHGRLPRNPARRDATFNDMIFNRLVRADWNSLERVCVDKEYVKLFARAVCPQLRTAATAAVIRLDRSSRLDIVESALLARAGQNLVAKPTHASGMILFLRKNPSRQEINRFCIEASQSYYRRSRESLYAGMERKILIEEDLSSDDCAPVDYKFFCARGNVFFCQIDVGRFTYHQRALVTPAFEPIGVRYMHDVPPGALTRPHNFPCMIDIAKKLSAFFSFVRVDLYSIRGVVFLGELTLAPEGAAGSLSDESFGARVMAGIRTANRSPEAGSGEDIFRTNAAGPTASSNTSDAANSHRDNVEHHVA